MWTIQKQGNFHWIIKMNCGSDATSLFAGIAGPPSWAWSIPLIVGVIAVLGVGVTAAVSIFNMKKQTKSAHALKIAEMRQEWINKLREAMASFQSYGVTPSLNHAAMREYYEKGTAIELFMNPKDPDYDELQRCLYAFLYAKTEEEKSAANPGFVAVCQRILKREWDTLKRAAADAAR